MSAHDAGTENLKDSPTNPEPSATGSPNILLFMTDQQRYDSLGCYGSEAAHTPNLDRLASEGALFERCYVNNPICTPSRASMLTGKHLPGHGVYRLYDCLPPEEVLFPEHLRNAGYRTGLFGKLHVSAHAFEREQRNPHDGFDVYEWCPEASIELDSPMNAYGKWLQENHPEFAERLSTDRRKLLHHPREVHYTHWAAERTIDFIRNRDRSQPFFAMMSIFDPHNPYDHYPSEMAERIDADKIPEPLVIEGELDRLPDGIRKEHESRYTGFSEQGPDFFREARFGYNAAIAFADDEMGRVLEVLRDEGIEENTLVLFVSDHGDMLGDHSLAVKGAFFFEPNVHVPLLMRWPARIPVGTRVKSLVQVHDVAATILSAAGIDDDFIAEHAPDSCDLLPLASGEQDRVRDWAVTVHRNSSIRPGRLYHDPPILATMFCEERYKLGVYHSAPENDAIRGTLFDMQEDPEERNNLWDDPAYAAVRLRLTERLLDWQVGQEMRYGRRGADAEPAASGRVINDPTRHA